MPQTIPAMIKEMHRLRGKIEAEAVFDSAADLAKIFDKAEVDLAKQQGLFEALLTDGGGNIQNVPANLEAAGAYFRNVVEPQINDVLVGPGKQWAEGNVVNMHAAGRRLARANLDVSGVSPELVSAAFKNVSIAEKGILKVGYTSGYQIMNVVGDDVGTWFRQTMLDSVVEGIPVDHVNPNVDSLKSRLIKSGRIQPITIKSETGKIINRSIKQRAQAIARIESTRIINRTHEELAEETLGDEAVFRNSNPQDSRSTYICEHASQQKAMSLHEWDNSKFGRPPRLKPFHLCRSILIAGRKEWFDDVPESQLQGAGLAKTVPGPPPPKTPKQKKADATAEAVQAALKQAAAQAQQLLPVAAAPAKVATLGKEIDDILSSPQAHLQQTKVDKLLSQFQEVAPAAVWAAKKNLAVSVAKSGKLSDISKNIEAGIPAAAHKMVDDAVALNAAADSPKPLDPFFGAGSGLTKIDKEKMDPGSPLASWLKQADDLDLPEADDLRKKWDYAWEIQVVNRVSVWREKYSDAWIAADIIDNVPEQYAAKLKAFEAMSRSGLFEPYSLGPKSEALAELLAKVEFLKTAAKIDEYDDLLDSSGEGKLGPKKLVTVQKKIKKLGEELFELKMTSFNAEQVADNISDALNVAASKVNPEILAFHAEYQKLVTTKKITPVQAGEILEKHKAGKLHGKSSTKAKQAVDAVKAKLDPPPPIVPDAPDPPPSLDVDPFEQVDKDWDSINPTTAEGWQSQGTANVGGAHSKEFWVDPDGSRWMFKPFPSVSKKEAAFRGMVDEFAYKMQRRIDPSAAEARFVEFPDGRAGSIQRWIEGADGTLKGVPLEGLTRAQLEVLQREHVLDWLISNHDGHGGQFITFADGRVVGVDKGQAFRFFGDDKMDFDYHPNVRYGESEPIYNTLMKGLRAGGIELDPKVTLAAVEQFEAISDDAYRKLLSPYAVNRFNTSAQIAKFLDQAVARKNSLRSDFEEYYQRALKDPTFKFAGVPAEGAVSSAVDGVRLKRFGMLGEETLEAVTDAEYQGKELQIAGTEFESQSTLIFADVLNGQPRTNLIAKTLDRSESTLDKTLVDFFESQDVTGDVHTAAVVVEEIGKPLAIDKFAEPIKKAVITLNAHVKSGDFAFNDATLDVMNKLKVELQALEYSPDADVRSMATGYLKTIYDVNDHVSSKSQLKTFAPDVSGPQGFDAYKRKALFEVEPAATVEQAAGGKLKVELTEPLGTMRKSKDGRLEVVKEDATLKDLHPGFSNIGVQYTARLEDGSIIRYRPWMDKEGKETSTYYAQRGEIEVIVPGKPGVVTGERALEILEDIGVKVEPPGPDDLEFVYLTKVAYAATEHLKPRYQTMIANIPADATAATRVAHLRKYWETKLGIDDLTKHPAYAPQGQFAPAYQEWRIKAERKDAGRRFWYRFDVDEAKFNREMKSYHVHQYTDGIYNSTDYTTLEFLKRSLGENGSLLSTRERARVGIKAGESPGSDMVKGGANYVYTRIRTKAGGKTGLAWKVHTLKRTDAVSYNYDAFGEMRGNHPENRRAVGLKADAQDAEVFGSGRSWREYASKTANETLFKYDMSLLEDLEAVIFDRQESVEEAVELFKVSGITELPDGRSVEEVIMTFTDYKRRR